MKSLVAFLFLTSISGVVAIGQPVLNASNSVPPVGVRYVGYYNNNFTPSGGLGGQSWDFSSQSFGSPLSNKIYACSAVANCGNFPGTTIVDKDTLASSSNPLPEVYMKGNSNALAVTGLLWGGQEFVYTDPDDIIRFPMTYMNGYVDPFKGSFVVGSSKYYRFGVDTVRADGWGTLKTPAGSFPNTLRIKRVQSFKDSSDPGFVYQWTITSYTWYSPSYKIYLFKTDSSSYTLMGNTQTTYSSTYTTGQTGATGIETAFGDGSIVVYPMPAKEVLHIFVRLPIAAPLRITLLDALGRVVKEDVRIISATEEKIDLPLSGVRPGIYAMQIRCGDDLSVRRVVVD
jgi:hypothetical protein